VTRLLDILLSFLSITILFPFMIPIMIALALTGEHKVFYLQPRVGRGGKEFRVLKFATMLMDSPSLPGGVLTQKDDPRVLPLGKLLRNTKINELPQLVNVFLGQMSFVGPRPQARRHYELYSDEVKKAIDGVRPGLTGIGSVVFRDEERILDKVSGNRDDFHDTVIAPYKGELEVWYSKHRNLRNYSILILLTILSLLVPSVALYKKLFKDLPRVPMPLSMLISQHVSNAFPL
jgi:lipopolysaccharide/colanic/teichoic acid biosynthesis glycosyltransferase